MEIRRVQVLVEGRVQGVGYRMFVRDLAARYHLSGWVMNRPDGSVMAEIEGDADTLDEMTDAMYARDSYIIRVDRMSVTPMSVQGGSAFEIRR